MKDKTLTCAYSTCPNDTFIFCRMAREENVEVHLYDVETLNQLAFTGRFDVTKLSFHAWLRVREAYEMLNVGAALGRGCGPLVIRQQDMQGSGGHISHLRRCDKVAVPGEYTTAHLLLRLWDPRLENRIFMPFDRIMDAVESGEADAGVIIHEGRFVYRERGFECIMDLGEWWEGETGLPIPLGCIAARRSLGTERIAGIERQLKRSVHTAFDDPGSTTAYVKEHAQEMDAEVLRRHIETYVNDFTLDLGEEGRAAIAKLKEMAEAAGVIS